MRRVEEPEATRWLARSRACLDAASLLETSSAQAWPRARLLHLALECHMKAAIARLRGGIPDTHDLTRLLTLARHCGLHVDQADADTFLTLAGRCDGVDPEPPGAGEVEQLCRRLDAP